MVVKLGLDEFGGTASENKGLISLLTLSVDEAGKILRFTNSGLQPSSWGLSAAALSGPLGGLRLGDSAR